MSFVVEQAWRALETTNRSIDRADAKAAVVLAASGTTGVVLFGLVDGHKTLGSWAEAMLVLSAVLTFAASAFAGLTLRPRRERRTALPSLLYFDHIMRIPDATATTYVELAKALFLDPEALCGDIVGQVWATGRVATAKYTWVNRSLICLFGALVTAGITALIIGV